MCANVTSAVDDHFDIRRWGTFQKAMRIMAWCLRFAHNSRTDAGQRLGGELSYDELSGAIPPYGSCPPLLVRMVS